MEAQEMAVEGQGVETPVDAPEASPATEQPGGDDQSASGDGSLNQKSENRFQKLLSENKRYRDREREFEDFKRANEAGINFHQALSKQNPQALQVLIELNDLMLKQGRSPDQIRKVIQDFVKQEQVNPYADYDKPIQELAQKTLSAEEKVEKILQEIESYKKSEVTTHQQMLDHEFDRRLVQDGFISKEGTFNELEVFLVSNAVRTLLDKYAKNPDKPTLEEMDKAYDLVKQTLHKQGGKALKSVSKTPSAPPSGTKKGQMVTPAKGAKGKALSIEEMVAMMPD